MGVNRSDWGSWVGACALAGALLCFSCGDDDSDGTPAKGPDAQPAHDAAARMDASRDAAAHHDAAAVMHDAAARDSGATLDADVLDATMADAVVDAGGGDAAMTVTPIPETLADTGLFASGSSGALAPGVIAYEPRYVLWADDAEKQRWFYLPEGTQIDTSDMNHWKFPVGTKAWKLFTLNGKKLETRLLQKTADRGWLRIAFAWNDDETEAVAML